MGRALGMVEYKTVSTGVLAADLVLKTADVRIIEAQTVCPGKYIVIFEGDISAVRASVDAAAARYPEQLIDSFLLGNPHEGIFPAIYGTVDRRGGSDRDPCGTRYVRQIICIPHRRGCSGHRSDQQGRSRSQCTRHVSGQLCHRESGCTVVGYDFIRVKKRLSVFPTAILHNATMSMEWVCEGYKTMGRMAICWQRREETRF